MNFKKKLIKENKLKWLEVGCGDNFDKDFYYIDTYPETIIDPKFKKRYMRLDITKDIGELLKKFGKFDFIRMQHVLEHLAYEDTEKALKNCLKLLKKGGYILITTPDLRIHLQTYMNNQYSELKNFKW